MGSKVNRSFYGYIFVAPFFIGFAVFGLMPILYTLYLSFMKWDGFSDPVYVGLANYSRLLHDSFFYQTIGNTLIIWILSNVPQLILSVLLALVLNERFIRGKHFFRAVYFFPHIITPVTLGVIFSLMFDWQTGTINKLLMSLGIIHDPVNWFNSPWWSRIIASGVICWQYFGFNMIVFIAGLQGIPREVYEAAEVDGATKKQTAMHITLPLLRPVFLFVFITSVIGGLQLFDAPLMLGDGPGNSSRTMVMYLYETAFKNFDYSYGAAVAYGIFFVVMFFTAITAKASKLKD
ncbi:carbohydrate ABC transporter permease [Paenibacillus cellulositrophicus]|jgi:ABC-type sugar transport system permease subunit|uniref:ABC transporter n=3 Tax=Paenibacillus TaxID=44249 RepID=A0A1R1EFA4_9BACL|nr:MULTISPECIES: sugar ABC transporter permease [Paenibacillus]MCM3001480.1 sugar ABC transporter permease [Paenibacillus cellulositrophicus]MEC0174548.1 sugar ABC transporter permease [Paenibacillus favisporus]OMF50500.1 ABC transporter [Paenibacillus rhizosphaerae]OXL85658.1 ABC transporter [Paenibacillus sp. SSG-1]RED32362.1 carbohydrate ABC transporter membrane protein 1 (CUT1 family) [Paenibacillus sp. VMFN-D1]